MVRLLLLVIISLAFFIVGCGDDIHNNFLPSPLPDNPTKCLGDPCLPGCEPHDFVCPPPVDDPPEEKPCEFGWRCN